MAVNTMNYIGIRTTKDTICITGTSTLYPYERRELINEIKMLIAPYRDPNFEYEE